jgi:hypothetical protein
MLAAIPKGDILEMRNVHKANGKNRVQTKLLHHWFPQSTENDQGNHNSSQISGSAECSGHRPDNVIIDTLVQLRVCRVIRVPTGCKWLTFCKWNNAENEHVSHYKGQAGSNSPKEIAIIEDVDQP